MIKAECELKVRYNECDMYGHVNHAVYLTYLEHARTEFMKTLGISIMELAEKGYRLFIVSISIHYRRSAGYDDRLSIITAVARVRNAGGEFRQQIFCRGEELIQADVKWACIDDSGRPVRLPAFLLTALKNGETAETESTSSQV